MMIEDHSYPDIIITFLSLRQWVMICFRQRDRVRIVADLNNMKAWYPKTQSRMPQRKLSLVLSTEMAKE